MLQRIRGALQVVDRKIYETYSGAMKIFILRFGVCLLFMNSAALAEECKDTNLQLEISSLQPASNLKRTFYKKSKFWFTQETHPQEPNKLNYDTTIVALAPNGQLIKVLAEGHSRDFGVQTKWINDHLLSVDVEWGHILSCAYDIDLKKKKISVSK